MHAFEAEFCSQVTDGEPGDIVIRATREEWQALVSSLNSGQPSTVAGIIPSSVLDELEAHH